MTEQSVTKHPIHNAAVYGTFSDFEALVNKVGSQEELVKLFQAQDEEGNTIIHHIAGGKGASTRSNCLTNTLGDYDIDLLFEYCWVVEEWIATDEVKKLRAIRDICGWNQWIALMKTQNNLGETALHRATGSFDAAGEESTMYIFRYLVDTISRDKHGILAIKCKRGHTAIHVAAGNPSPDPLEIIVGSFDQGSLGGFELLKEPNEDGVPILSQLSGEESVFGFGCKFGIPTNQKYNAFAARVIRDQVTQEQWFYLLNQTNSQHETSFHWLMMEDGHRPTREYILNSLSKQNLINLLAAESTKNEDFINNLGATLARDYINDHKYNSITLICQLVEHDVGYHLVKSLFQGFIAASDIYSDCNHVAPRVAMILDNVAPEYQLKLVGEKSGLESELISGPESYEYPHYFEIAGRLQRSRTRSKVSIAISTIDSEEQNEKLSDIIENEPLTTDQIKQLSSLGDRYIVPFNQTNSKTYTIILHNTNNRPGGDTEADVMEQAMRDTGSDVIKIEWSDTCELNNMIDSAVTGLLSDCSLLVVCIMAHGYQGTLSGSGSSELPINNILHQLTALLPPPIPLVTIIQACQDYARLSQPPGAASQPDEGTSSDSESETDPARPTQTLHVILTRPHTVLLLATVTGGVAYRGNFTGAIAQQFSLSDGKTEICEMFRRAVSNMPKVEQTPEMRTTMGKTLIVPPAIDRTDSENLGAASSESYDDYYW